jgi:beta-glucosidase
MTVEEKAAQVSAPFGAAVNVHEPPPTGWGNVAAGLCNLDLSPRDTAHAGNELQRKHIEGTRLGIPVLFSEEALVGLKVRDATSFPDAIAQACTWEPELIEAMAQAIGEQMACIGVRQALSPLADVARDPRWGRVEETYGEDPYLVGCMATAFVRGLQDADGPAPRIATLKHFVGYSASAGGRNTEPASLGPRELREVHTLPFEMAIRVGGARGVMPAYNAIDGEAITGSKAFLTTLLRDELGLDGITISDLNAVPQLHTRHRVAKDPIEAAAQAFQAGLDFNLDMQASAPVVIEAVRTGALAEGDLDRAVHNVLRTKFELGLFENPYVDVDRVPPTLDSAEDRALARRIAEKSIVLLQNHPFDGRPVLPLGDDRQTIAVVGPNADRLMGQLGNYSYQVLDSVTKRFNLASDPQARPEEIADAIGGMTADDNSLLVESVPVVTFLEGIRQRAGDRTVDFEPGCPVAAEDRSGIAAAVSAATAADVAIVVVGDQAGINGFGTVGEGLDSTECALPGVQRELVEAVAATGTPTIVVLSHGRPYVLGWMSDLVPAILTGFFGGEEAGTAMASVLFGDVNPAGRLPVSMLRSVGAAPITYARTLQDSGYVDGSAGAVFPFGHGLSYTKFEYRDLEISEPDVPTDGHIRLSFTVANVGDRPGDEVIQVYGHDVIARTARRGRTLVAFCRLHLGPGEGARVDVAVPTALFALWDDDEGWLVEPGDVNLFVGPSSAMTRLRGQVTLSGDVHNAGPDRPLMSTTQVTVSDETFTATAETELVVPKLDRSITPVSATNTVREWLDHPVGGVLLRTAFGGRRFDEEALRPAFDIALGQLVALSGGRFTQSTLDDLLEKVENGSVASGDAWSP